MDGRDSSPAAGEDDRISAASDGLAKEAEVLFASGRFSDCVDVLNQLMSKKKEGDPKVLHNIAVAEYFRDGCSDPRKLLDMLNKIKKRSEELARSSGEQADSSGNLGNNLSVSKGSGTDAGSNAYSDEFDTSFLTLNTAIILYHLHEYAHALSILGPLYQNLHPLDETTALHVCLLLLDIALDSHDAAKAADVIQYLEKCFATGYKASITDENSLSGPLSDDALEYENLYSALDGSRPSSNRTAPATCLKLKMHLYKVRLLLLTRNPKAAKREVKLAMNMARGRDSSAELLLKSQVEYARGNYRKAVKLLTTSSSNMLSIFNNNLGCIHYRQSGRHTSALFFAKALRHSSSLLRLEKPLKLHTFSHDRSLEITYNLGVQNLTCGRPSLAAKCFGKASFAFFNRPLLWLRLAECCLSAMEKGLGDVVVTVHVVGSGAWRKLVVDDVSNECELSLPFARYCLQNALLLLNKSDDSLADSNGEYKENKVILSSVAAYEEMRREESRAIRQAVLGDLAYVELGLENPVKAIFFSRSLLELAECEKMYVFLGHVYVAEALVGLGRVEEAAEHLSGYLTEESSVELLSPREARGVVAVNLASVFATRGELEKAGRFAAQALSLIPNHPKALLAALYVEILQGKTQEAILKLKQFSRVRYLSNDVTLSSS